MTVLAFAKCHPACTARRRSSRALIRYRRDEHQRKPEVEHIVEGVRPPDPVEREAAEREVGGDDRQVVGGEASACQRRQVEARGDEHDRCAGRECPEARVEHAAVRAPGGSCRGATFARNTAARNNDAVPRRHNRKIQAEACAFPKSGAPSAPGNAATWASAIAALYTYAHPRTEKRVATRAPELVEQQKRGADVRERDAAVADGDELGHPRARELRPGNRAERDSRVQQREQREDPPLGDRRGTDLGSYIGRGQRGGRSWRI
jgi:hypothetical protein